MINFASINEQMDLILRGSEEIIPIEELEKRINKNKNAEEDLIESTAKKKSK